VFDWISFDCYGTLIDWERGATAALASLLRRHGVTRDVAGAFVRWEQLQREWIQPPYRPYREVLARSAWALMREMGVWISPAEEQEFADSIRGWPAFEDAAPALAAARAKGRTAILSNTDPDLLAASLETLGSAADATVTAADARAYKPDPAFFRSSRERLGLTPGRWLHVAFGFDYDLAPARAEGAAVVWVNRKGARRPPGVAPDHEIRTLADLASVI
jgi:2-haloalkanoic acid dehalogenase type II